jgi:tetratricopeptide (TPR) repeat protein
VLIIYVDLTRYLSFKNKKHFEEALGYAMKLQRMFPKHAKPYALLVQVYEQAYDAQGVKDYAKKAVENFEQAFKIHPLTGKQKETWDGCLARLRKDYSN